MLFVFAQAISSNSTKNTEGQDYTVIKKYSDFEIRQYSPALFSYTVMKADTYKKVSGKGFRKLAGYIFGGNDKKQSIAMTTPVAMDISDSITMKFKIPKGLRIEDLPTPNDSDVKFKAEPAKKMAAIAFSGWATDDKIEKYTLKLKLLLKKKNLTYKGNFIYLGYNPPYEVTNRRNEIVVEIAE
ncbi:MAG: SOUL family heme-binding protein [Bacteroidia bacterium]